MQVSYLIIDIENNSSEQAKKFGRKAGTPLLGDKIVAISLKNQSEQTTQYLFPNELKEFYIDEEVLVGHNLSHDLQWLWTLESFQDWLKAGGVIWDTQLAHYILTGQQDKYPALRDIATRCYNCPERQKLMEPYWDKGIQTSDIPIEIVLEDVKNDVLDTEQIYLQQLKLAEKQGQTKLIELQNDALLATLEMSYNGLKIDIDRLHKNKLELEQKLEAKKAELAELIKPWWK